MIIFFKTIFFFYLQNPPLSTQRKGWSTYCSERKRVLCWSIYLYYYLLVYVSPLRIYFLSLILTGAIGLKLWIFLLLKFIRKKLGKKIFFLNYSVGFFLFWLFINISGRVYSGYAGGLMWLSLRQRLTTETRKTEAAGPTKIRKQDPPLDLSDWDQKN